MQYPDGMAIDRALHFLPRDDTGYREKLIAALTNDALEDGVFPRYPNVKTVGDVRRLGPQGLLALPAMAELGPNAAEWLIERFAASASSTATSNPAPALDTAAPAGPDLDRYLLIMERICEEGGPTFADRVNRLGLQHRDQIDFIAYMAELMFPHAFTRGDRETAVLRSADFGTFKARLRAAIEARNAAAAASEPEPGHDHEPAPTPAPQAKGRKVQKVARVTPPAARIPKGSALEHILNDAS